VGRLAAVRKLLAAFVVGSVARGDFNVWSAVDVVVVADNLPSPGPGPRASIGTDRATPSTTGRLRARRVPRSHAKGKPLVREAIEIGIPLAGADLPGR
jgi:predicted nucleotidyltransferase